MKQLLFIAGMVLLAACQPSEKKRSNTQSVTTHIKGNGNRIINYQSGNSDNSYDIVDSSGNHIQVSGSDHTYIESNGKVLLND